MPSLQSDPVLPAVDVRRFVAKLEVWAATALTPEEQVFLDDIVVSAVAAEPHHLRALIRSMSGREPRPDRLPAAAPRRDSACCTTT